MLPARRWLAIDLPGLTERHRTTYWPADLDAMPPIRRSLDGSLDWLPAPSGRHAVERSSGALEEADDAPGSDVTERLRTRLDALVGDFPLPPAFRRFVLDPAVTWRVPSATACFLNLADFPVRLAGGGALISFLSDQQWVLNWLLEVSPGASRVLVTPEPLGFDGLDAADVRVLDSEQAASRLLVCADSFDEFLYRFWMDNELFFRLVKDRTAPGDLPAELREYAAAYPRDVPPLPLPLADWRP